MVKRIVAYTKHINACIYVCRYELGSRWNYLLALGNIGCRNDSDPSCGWPDSPRPSLVMETIDMVNANPDTMGFEYYLTRQNNHDMQVFLAHGFLRTTRAVNLPVRVLCRSGR